MKKTLSINLNGRAFNIDEDAYELLENYLHNLKSYFRKEKDSAEIIRDFEARIEELFQERIRLGYNVISIEQVETIIERMGKPEDFGDREQDSEEAVNNNINKEQSAAEEKPKKRFYRNIDDKMLGGVCSGIAAYFGWDTLPVRIIFFILIFFTQLFMIPVYLFLWIFMPAAVSASQKLEMRGEAITLENIGKTVSETTATANKNNDGFLQTSLKLGLGCFGCLIALPLLFALFIVIVVLISLIFGFSSALFFPLDFLGFDWNGVATTHPIISSVALILVLGIPLFSIIYALLSSNKKVKPLNKTTKWIGFLVWIIALIALILSGIQLSKEFNFTNKHKDWNITYNTGSNAIEGSGAIADRTEELPSFSQLKIDDDLIATVRIRQGANSNILINGDDNIINKIKWESEGEELELGISDHANLQFKSNLIIIVTTPKISEVKMGALSKVSVDNKVETPDFRLRVEGAGSFIADSLYVQNLDCSMEGIGKITLGGKANRASMKLEGAGKIEASELKTDSLTAKLQGVGSIKCNPIAFLDASLDGVGKITYKEEPKTKKTSINGMGKLGKE